MVTLPDTGVMSNLSTFPETGPQAQSSSNDSDIRLIDISQSINCNLINVSQLHDELLLDFKLPECTFLSHRLCPKNIEISFQTADSQYRNLIPQGENPLKVRFYLKIDFNDEIDLRDSSTGYGDNVLLFTVSFVLKDKVAQEVNRLNKLLKCSDGQQARDEEMPPLEEVDRNNCDIEKGPLKLFGPPTATKTGLYNSGNTCYQNSILQAFVRIGPWKAFAQAFNRSKPPESVDSSESQDYHLLNIISAFTLRINSNKLPTLSADAIKVAMRKYTRLFENNQQHDAPEYFNSLISALNIELKKFVISKRIVDDEQETASADTEANNRGENCLSPMDNSEEARNERLRELSNIRWKEFFRTQPTLLTDLFCGQTAQRLVCQECSHESNIIEPFEVLILNLPQATVAYHLLFFARDPVTCCCTDMKRYVFRFPPDIPVENMLAALSSCVDCPIDNIRLVQPSPDGEQFPIGLKNKCLLSDTVRDPNLPILAFQSEQSDDIIEFSILQKTLLRHMSQFFHHLVAITDKELSDGQRAVGFPFIIYMKKSLINYKDFTKVLMSYALKSINVLIDLCPDKVCDLSAAFNSLVPPTLIYYKSQKAFESNEIYAPFLLKDHGSNQEIRPELIDGDYSGEAPLKMYGYCIELQWINDHNPEHFPPFGMINNIGNRSYNDIELALQYEHHSNLHDCLKIFSKEEDLGHDAGWKCNNCKQVRVAKKSAHLIRTPHVLVVQLVRFKYNENDTTAKVHDKIEFPVDGLDLSGWVLPNNNNEIYDLYAVVNHYGHCFGGHYSVAVRDWDKSTGPRDNEPEWFLFDDASVTPILNPQKELVTSFAYLLFFKRRDFPDTIFNFSDLCAEQTCETVNCD